jgi:hypothetical protein
VDTIKAVRPVEARWFGVNTAVWDAHFDKPETTDHLLLAVYAVRQLILKIFPVVPIFKQWP